MEVNETKCIKCVGKCSIIIKYEKTKVGNQRYICKMCGKIKVVNYTYKAYQTGTNENIILFTKEGCRIISIARILKISTTTLLKRIVAIAKSIVQPIISKGKTYQVDEMRTYIKRKDRLFWIVYALQEETRKVVSFTVGKRTNEILKEVITSLRLSYTKRLLQIN